MPFRWRQASRAGAVLAFDHEGRPIQFDTWLDDLQLYLLSDSKDSVLLFDLASGAAPATPTTPDNATRSQWLTRNAAARLAICNHLLLAECAHFGHHRTAQALYDAVVARYSSPATAAPGRLLLPYLFPELSAFATVQDLVSHLRTSDARYRATVPIEFLDRNQPPMFITLYFIVTRFPDSLRSVRDHFLSLDPTSLTVDLLEQHLLAAETSAVAIGAARGTPRPPFFEGTLELLLLVQSAAAARARVAGVVEGAAGVVVGAAVEVVEAVEVAVGLELGVEVLEVASGSSSSVGARPSRPSSFVSGCFSVVRLGRPRWADLLRSGVAIFDPDFDDIIFAMYALSASAEGDCYWCVPPDPGIAAATLGASESVLPGTAPAEALQTFTLDSGASRRFFCDSTTLTPLPAPVPVRLADPSGGPVVACSSTVLPCPAVPSSSLSGLHLPSFSTNLVSTAALQDVMVTTTTPGGQHVLICTCTRTSRHLATFTCRPGSSLYTLATEPPQVVVSAQVSASGLVALPCLCRLLSHQTLQWHHRLGHPSLPRLRGMHFHLLVSGLPRSLPPLPPSPALPCLPCVEGRQRAAPHSSSFPPMTAPLQTLHMDVWGPARVSGQGREHYFLLVVDDYTRYTTVFPLRSKGQVVDVLIPWIRTVRLQLRERFSTDLPVLRLHSDRGGEFSSDLLRDFCRGEGILQSFMLPDSPQQNGIDKRRIGLVMEVARTFMIHAAAPHFLWPFAVRYAAHQLNLWPRVSLPETSPRLRWTGKVGNASVFRVWGSCAFVRDTSADKLSACAIPCSSLPAVTDPSFESTAASAFVAEQLDFAAACRLDYDTPLVAESAPASPPSVKDLDAPDIPTPRSYAEVITCPYSSQWQTAMDVEMASWKSTGTYVNAVPPSGTNIVDGMWIFRVKRPPGSPCVFKARYVARGFSQQQGVDFFHTFSPTLKMTTLWVLLHVAAQRDYELHSLDFSTAFLQGSLHEEIWLRCPFGFTGSFPASTQWSLRWPVYALRLVPREWHDTPRTTIAALGFAPSTADPSLFLRTDTLLPPFYVLVYVDDLVFATADTEALTLVKSELQKRHTCTDLGELRSYLGLQITRDRARCTITLTQSHMVQQVLQRFGLIFSSPQPTPLSTSHSFSAPPSDESVEPSGPYLELVGCLMYLMTCIQPDLAYPLSLLARYVAPGRHRKVHWDAAKRVLRYLCSMSGMGLVLGGRGPVVLTGHVDASWVDDSATQRSSRGYTFSLGSGSISWRSTHSSLALSSSCEAEIYAGAMATQELRWLTYLLSDLGEQPRLPPVLYVDNKAIIALCQEHRLEHRTKHIALRHFLAWPAAAWPASSCVRGHSGQHY
ncbi:unnamed protein product [Closterium sp. NIES-54]